VTVLLLPVIAAVVLAGVATILARPQRGLLALVALAPFHGLLVIAPLPSIATGWKEGVVLLTLAASLARPAAPRVGGRLTSWQFAAGAWVLLGVASVVVGGRISALVGLKVSFFYLLLVVVALRTPLTRRDRDVLVTVLMFNGFVTSVYGIVQQALGPTRLHALGYPYDDVIRTAGGHLRSFSTFNQPFPFAFFVMTVLLVCLPIALSEPRRVRNQLFLLASPVLALGMLTAIVRGAILGLLVGLLVLAARRYRVVLVGLPVAGALLVLAPASLATTVTSASSLQERTAVWSARLGQLINAPFGNGVGTTGSAADKTAGLGAAGGPGGVDALLKSYAGTASPLRARSGSVAPSIVAVQPDNAYYITAYELGIPGLWLMLLTFVGALADFSRLGSLVRPEDRPWADSLTALVAAVLAVSVVSAYLQLFPDELLLWLLLGIASSIPRAASGTPPRESSQLPPPAVARVG